MKSNNSSHRASDSRVELVEGWDGGGLDRRAAGIVKEYHIVIKCVFPFRLYTNVVLAELSSLISVIVKLYLTKCGKMNGNL